jgi:hypothetical protein
MFSLGQNNVPQASSPTPQVNQQQIAFVKNLLAQKGITAEAWVRQLCSQRGINVDEFMAQFRDVTLP